MGKAAQLLEVSYRVYSSMWYHLLWRMQSAGEGGAAWFYIVCGLMMQSEYQQDEQWKEC